MPLSGCGEPRAEVSRSAFLSQALYKLGKRFLVGNKHGLIAVLVYPVRTSHSFQLSSFASITFQTATQRKLSCAQNSL